jgi:hypothetical protein
MHQRIKDEDTLISHFFDADEELLEHICLPRDATWGDFRQHYAKGKGIDIERAANDVATLPSYVARLAYLRRQIAEGS